MEYELVISLGRLQRAMDILLDLEGIKWNPQIGDYIQVEDEDEEEDNQEEKEEEEHGKSSRPKQPED